MTSRGENDEIVYLTGRSVEALTVWLEAAKIEKGSILRAIDRRGTILICPLDQTAINDIVKQRVKLAGLDPRNFPHMASGRDI